MAVGDITYGTPVALANVSRLNSNINGVAEAFGEIQGAGEIVNDIHLVIPINSSATGGTYDVYLVESHDGAEWTDNIDPSASGDVAANISDAKLLASADTTYNASNRAEVELHFPISMLGVAEYIGLVVLNNSGQTIPASGSDGDSTSKTVSA